MITKVPIPFQRWLINGVPFARNPDDYHLTPVTPNVTYTVEASGRQVRTGARRVISAMQLELDWHTVDEKTRRSLALLTQTSGISKIVLTNTQPQMSIWAYLDAPKTDYTKDAVDQYTRSAGHRRDITITGNTDEPFYHSYYNVPNNLTVDPTYVASAFSGELNNTLLDYVPTWNGYAWNQPLVLNAPNRIPNMGTAPWSPIIKINGPFSALTINIAYEDVDGTGLGVNFTWLGNPLAAGDFLLIDTSALRVYVSQGTSQINYPSGALQIIQFVLPPLNEVYTFSLTTTANGIPFPDWPPAPMGEFVITPTALAGATSSTTIDYSNNGLETFRYR